MSWTLVHGSCFYSVIVIEDLQKYGPDSVANCVHLTSAEFNDIIVTQCTIAGSDNDLFLMQLIVNVLEENQMLKKAELQQYIIIKDHNNNHYHKNSFMYYCHMINIIFN